MNQIVADGNGLISAGPNILDASQSPEQYHQNFQGNYNAQYDHAQANPTGQSTGVPIYDQGFDFSDAGIDALLPPTGEADTSAGSTAWGPLAGIENFLAGIGGKNVQDTRYGVTGNRTAQQQANLEAAQANPTAAGAATAARGQIEGKQTAATKQANAYVNEQAKFNATATAEEKAANEQTQLLGDFLWKYEGADNSQMKANYAAQAKAAGLDFGGKSASDFVTTVPNADKGKLKADARAALTAEQQGIKAVDGGFNTPKTTAETAQGTDVLFNGQTRNSVNAQHQAQAAFTGANADQSAGAQQAYQNTVQSGDQATYDKSVAKFGVEEANRLANQSGSSANQIGHNTGGPISGYNTGGQAMSPDELRRQQEAQAGKIAQSRLQATPPPPPKAPLQSGGGGGGGPGIAGQIGGQLLKTGLGAALGPFGAILGGLFNEGGAVQNLNEGGWLSKLFGGTGKPRTSRWGGEATKAPRTQTTGLPSRPLPGGINLTNPYKVKRDAAYAAHAKSGKPSIWEKLGLNTGGHVELSTAMRNMGGPLSMNPNGYNEGGQTQATPIKKVMDMEKLESQKMMDQQKLAQAEKAFMMAEGRKDEAAEQAMMQKEESHQQAMKLKKDSATMAGPLSGGK